MVAKFILLSAKNFNELPLVHYLRYLSSLEEEENPFVIS